MVDSILTVESNGTRDAILELTRNNYQVVESDTEKSTASSTEECSLEVMSKSISENSLSLSQIPSGPEKSSHCCDGTSCNEFKDPMSVTFETQKQTESQKCSDCAFTLNESMDAEDVLDAVRSGNDKTDDYDDKCIDIEAAVPTNLQRTHAGIQRPGAFRAPGMNCTTNDFTGNDSDIEQDVYSVTEPVESTDESFIEHNLRNGYATALEATLIDEGTDRESMFVPPTPALSTVTSDLVIAEVIPRGGVTTNNSPDHVEHCLTQEQQGGRTGYRLSWWKESTVILVLVTVTLTVLLNISVKELPSKPSNSTYSIDDLNLHRMVTHHAVVFGGPRSYAFNNDAVNLQLYCAGTTGTTDSDTAIIEILYQSSTAVKCVRIRSFQNALSCSFQGNEPSIESTSTPTKNDASAEYFTELTTENDDSIFQTGIVFSCQNKGFLDEDRVAAAVFLRPLMADDYPYATDINITSEESQYTMNNVSGLSLFTSPTGAMSSSINNSDASITYVALGHFCQTINSTRVTNWVLQPNIAFIGDLKLDDKCESSNAEFVDDDELILEYCVERIDEPVQNSSMLTLDGSVVLQNYNEFKVTDIFSRCHESTPVNEELISVFKSILLGALHQKELLLKVWNKNYVNPG